MVEGWEFGNTHEARALGIALISPKTSGLGEMKGRKGLCVGQALTRQSLPAFK